MALLDAYATDTQYRARTGDKGTGTDTTLNAQLLLASRLLERSLRVMPGAFNTHTGTYIFDALGGTVLRLRDRAGLGYFLQTITANSLGIDLDLDKTYDYYTLDLADAWVRGLPENAAAFSEPFTAIELLSHISTADPTRWPELVAGVRIVGTWGWAAVPNAVIDLTVHLVHDLRNAHQAGATLEVPTIDGSMPLSNQTWRLWNEMKARYGRRIPAVA